MNTKSKHYTLLDIMNHVPSREVINEIEKTWQLSRHNISVYRYRMDNGEVELCIYDMTHDGNDPRDNDRLLDFAACYYLAGVYTNEEWERYFLPAINKMIADNDSFVRWLPGYVIQQKETGTKAIVEFDYAYAFGGRNFTDLSIYNLDKEGNITCGWAWASYSNYKLIDTEHQQQNIKRIHDYNVSNGYRPPFGLSRELSQRFYGTDESPMPRFNPHYYE